MEVGLKIEREMKMEEVREKWKKERRISKTKLEILMLGRSRKTSSAAFVPIWKRTSQMEDVEEEEGNAGLAFKARRGLLTPDKKLVAPPCL